MCHKTVTIIFNHENIGWHSALRPDSTQENKHRIGLDFFPSSIIHTAGQKKVENTSTLYHPGCGSQVWYRKPMRGFNFVPIRSDPMPIFLSGNRPLQNYVFQLEKMVLRRKPNFPSPPFNIFREYLALTRTANNSLRKETGRLRENLRHSLD